MNSRENQGEALYIINSAGIAYNQHEVLYIIKPQKYTLKRDDIRRRQPPAIIYTPDVVMIYQACGLDKKSSFRKTRIFGGDGEIRTLENALTSYTISNRAPSTGLGDISVTPQYYTLRKLKNQALFINF